ncbi:substrate-binding domain-containing protein [Rhodanobacter sp. L36]|uniref:LysM peptidoglycan-binding domain-containing protein n=1 Tax=Rhodanobacter sp. L36 TaxID=1747221 RepID=UPI00131BD19E|nr:substrate-binding domain-containing protein [Rhodanobacter sp. L36]
MSVRLTRLLSVALIGACLATPAIAKTKTHTHSRAKASTAAKGPVLIWRGDVATAQGVVNEVAQAWSRAGHGTIELQPFNTASGIDAVALGTADLAGSARGTDETAQDAGLTFTPVAWDALVLITSSSNPVSNLTLKQAHDIYFGKITNWSEVGGSAAPIDVYAVASPGDGIEYSLRQLLFGRGTQPVAAPRLYVNTHKLEEGIELNPNGFGAATLGDIKGNSKVKAVSINGKFASVANIADGSYVLYTPLYLVTNPRSPKAAEVQTFIEFLQSDAVKTAMRNHSILPFQDGAALVTMDSGRRSRILAETGGHASHVTAISAPGATYAARAAVAPTSPDTAAAKQALDKRTIADKLGAAEKVAAEKGAQSDQTALTGVKGGVAATHVTSLAHVKGSATATGKKAGKGKKVADANDDQAKPAATGQTYKVAKGDTLFSIAKSHAVDVAQLRSWNHLKGDNVKPGQSLRISRD